VLLRPLVEADWSAVHEWACQERVCRYQPWGPNTEEQTRAFVREAAGVWATEPRTRFVFAITLEGAVIGNCELALRGRGQGEISYVLHPDRWRRGFGTAAARRLLEIGFREHRLHRVFATCDPRNVASAGVLRRLGMTHEGRLREALRIRDGWRDSDVYSLLDREWATTSSAARAGR
jgi:RimJ/RimL family protein N-acetyltransferase